MIYKYFQPNDKDTKDKYGDCAVRAICKAENLSWLDAYDIMYKYAREVQCPMNIKQGYEHILKSLGYEYGHFKHGGKRPNVKKFATEHKDGTYICVCANHYVCIKNGHYYDTWDSGEVHLYSYWYKKLIDKNKDI